MSVTEKDVQNALKKVKDPELNLDLVVLGLVYDIAIDDASVTATISLTSPMCPLAEQIVTDARMAIENVEGVESAEVKLTFDPPWTPDRIPPLIRSSLGLYNGSTRHPGCGKAGRLAGGEVSVSQIDVFQEVPEGVRHFDGTLRQRPRQRSGLIPLPCEVADDSCTHRSVRLCGGGVVLRIPGAHPLLEDRELGPGSSMVHHVLEDRLVEFVEPLLDEIVGGPAHECELHSAGVGPHEEDQHLLGGGLLGDAIIGGQAEFPQKCVGVTVGDEIGETLPHQLGESVTQLLGIHALGRAKLPGFVG